MRRSNIRTTMVGLFLCVAIVFGGMTAAANGPGSEKTNDPTWTVMVYMCSDNNLEPYALMDLDEMEKVGSKNGVTVIVLLDMLEFMDGTHWFVIEGDATDHINADTGEFSCDCEEVTGEACPEGTASELDMGDDDTLTNFIVQCVDYAPADKYMLILWDHGSGWRGVCFDETTPPINDLGWVSRLTVTETADSIEAAEQTILADRIDPDYRLTMLGYDACLMGMAEVVYENRYLADYMFASITLVSVLGQNYTGILEAVTYLPRMSDEDIGRAVVDSFVRFYEDYVPTGDGIEGWGDQSMTLYKLGDGVTTLVESIDALAQELLGGTYLETNRGAIESAESQTPKIESSSGEQLPYVDLGLFVEKLGEKIPELYEFTEPVRLAVENVAIYEDHVTAKGGAIMNTTGMTVYFTCCYNYINPAYQYEDISEIPEGADTTYYGLEFVIDTFWDEFVFTFCQAYDESLLVLETEV